MKRIISLCFAAVLMTAPVYASAQSAQDIMMKFSHEPTVEATMEAALEYSGLSSDRLESLYKRSGGANALPRQMYYEMTYRDRDTDRPQEATTYKNNDDSAWDQLKKTDYEENQAYIQHKVRAQWDLSRLVYNNDQKGVASLMSQVVQKRDKMLKDLNKAYFARRRAQIDLMMNPPQDVAQKLEADLKIQELTATLDAMTGGWFSKQLKNR